jgi:hypothetical protein
MALFLGHGPSTRVFKPPFDSFLAHHFVPSFFFTMTTMLHSHPIPFERDFYHHLRQLVLPLRDLLKTPVFPLPTPGSSLPVLRPNADRPACASLTNAELCHALEPFHEAFVSTSSLLFFLSSSRFFKVLHASRDPEFHSDPLVTKFLLSVSRVAAYLRDIFIPKEWDLWLNWEDAQSARSGVSTLSFSFILPLFPYFLAFLEPRRVR